MKWVTVWGNATSIAEHRPETYAKNLTLRYPVCCAFGGNAIRLHFSNFCGQEPITINCVSVAPALGDREINPKDARLITFGGEEAVTIQPGQEVFSDEVPFRVKPKGFISVSFYLQDFTQMRSGVVITGPLSKGFYSVGNHVLDPVLPLDQTRSTQMFYFLTGIDLYTEDDKRCIVCYGDSITSQSWPDYLAQECMRDPYNVTAIIRRAASGTRVLREYSCITYESYGLKGENRFDREMSTLSGCDTVIIQQGINDIIHPVGTDINPFRPMTELPTVEQLEEGIEYYLNIAKKYNLRTFLGTLLPIEGWRTYAPFREDMKNQFNEWVRHNAPCDGVIDFAKAVADPQNEKAFAQGYDSGDHLHPSESAYQKMASLAFEKLL